MFSNLIHGLKFLPDVTAGDSIGWLYAALCGIIAFFLIQRLQVKIERHRLLYDIENEFKNLFSKEIATYLKTNDIQTYLKNGNTDKAINFTNVNLRTVLGEEWNYNFKLNQTEINQIQYNNQRYWEILIKGKNTYYLASEAFQDTLSWFRRVKKLYKDKIIKPSDLSDLWRQILPFGCSGRLHYFGKYFSYNKDIESIIVILAETLISCHKLKMNYAVEYLIENATNNDLKLLSTNKKFQKLIKNYSYLKREGKTNNFYTIINKTQQEAAADISTEKET